MTEVATYIFGAAGFVGGEALRLVAGHSRLTLAAAVSASQAGTLVSAVHPHLRGPVFGDVHVSFVEPDAALAVLANEPEAVVLLAVDHADAPALAARVLAVRPDAAECFIIVDCSGAHRLRDAAQFEQWYGFAHPAPDSLADWTYSLPEITGTPATRRIANPGCYATCVQLALWPIVKSGLCDTHIAVTAITGSSGAGVHPRPTTHHPRRAANVKAYRALTHQHTPEMLQTLNAAAPEGRDVSLYFTPHQGPFVRGIYATATLCVSRRACEAAGIDAETLDVRALYAEAYADAPFVVVLPDGETPDLAAVVGSNRCDIGVTQRGRDVVVSAALDNLLKGAAGQAVQNINRALGWPETLGLPLAGPYPI